MGFIKRNHIILLVILICVIFSVIIQSKTSLVEDQHFVYLAGAYLKGTDHFNTCVEDIDLAYYNNKYYVYFPPAPALILLPFVLLFGEKINQYWLSIAATIISFIFIYKIARKNGLSEQLSLLLSTFFIFGTIYLSLALYNFSSYIQQTIGFTFLVLAISAFFYRKSWLLIGFLVMMAFLSRLTLILTAIFFLLEIFASSEANNKKISHFVQFMIPISLGMIFQLTNNYLHFGNMFETGHQYITYWCNPPYTFTERGPQGMFSITYIPTNLFLMLFKGLTPLKLANSDRLFAYPYFNPDFNSLSIFIISPLLLFVFMLNIDKKIIKHIWITVLAILFVTLTYYGGGGAQFGFRYSLDFFPFLFILLIFLFKEFKTIPVGIILLIFYSLLFNLFYLSHSWKAFLE